MIRNIVALILSACFCTSAMSQVEYPYPVKYLTLKLEQQQVQMAYMDATPLKPNGKSVLLLHGKNFNGYYWKDVAAFLTDKGYRVIIPDQIGWGRSDKPNLHYSFPMLAANTRALLDSLHIKEVVVVGHSMGGMLAVRFCLMYPDYVDKLVLENPIGLEDYKTFVPYQSIDQSFEKERKATYESYKKYQQTYYPEWKPEYEQYVQAQAEVLKSADFEKAAWANAVTYQMIYEQPVIYEISQLKLPVLLIIGQWDRTIVGKDLLPPAKQQQYGQYPQLGRKVHDMIKTSVLVEYPGVGHIPHVQNLPGFKEDVLLFFDK